MRRAARLNNSLETCQPDTTDKVVGNQGATIICRYKSRCYLHQFSQNPFHVPRIHTFQKDSRKQSKLHNGRLKSARKRLRLTPQGKQDAQSFPPTSSSACAFLDTHICPAVRVIVAAEVHSWALQTKKLILEDERVGSEGRNPVMISCNERWSAAGST